MVENLMKYISHKSHQIIHLLLLTDYKYRRISYNILSFFLLSNLPLNSNILGYFNSTRGIMVDYNRTENKILSILYPPLRILYFNLPQII